MYNATPAMNMILYIMTYIYISYRCVGISALKTISYTIASLTVRTYIYIVVVSIAISWFRCFFNYPTI